MKIIQYYLSVLLLLITIFQTNYLISGCTSYCNNYNTPFPFMISNGQESFNPNDLDRFDFSGAGPGNFTANPDDLSNSNDLGNQVVDTLKKASPVEIKNMHSILDNLNDPHDIKRMFDNLDSGNLSKVLHNLPSEELANIYKTLTTEETLKVFLNLNISKNECVSNNITQSGSDLNYTILEICKR
jgi:hypothetical protein